VRLPRVAEELAAGTVGLDEAVALYHLVLEGIVFAVGQHALLAELDRLGALPVVRHGVARVEADERWHIGLGTLCLARSAWPDPAGLGRSLARALDAAAAWGPDVSTPERTALVARRHHRRLAEAGLAALTPERAA
jgi:hypothetical protein